jgi:lipopolysaccharide export LptBFGC system permease protein LptF
MQTLFKLGYSLTVGLLLVLFVILGTRTFYDEPEEPRYPSGMPPSTKDLYCDFTDQCYLNGRSLTPQEEQQLLTADEREFIKGQREHNERQREYEDDRVDYHRNVFIVASVLGVAAIAAGLYLFRRVEAMPLGLLLGGLGVVIFGWAQAAEDFGEIGMAPLFAVVAVGLAIVLAAGYRFLGLVRPADEDRS